MDNLVTIYDSYKRFNGETVPIKIGWVSCVPVTIDEAQEFCWNLQHKIAKARKMEEREMISDSECMVKLEEYSKQIGLKETLTLSQLIESHRYLREVNKKIHEGLRKEIEEARENAKQKQLDNDWIRIETLQAMTVQELSEFLAQ